VKVVYLGLGANLGDRLRALRGAIAALEAPDLHVTRVSQVYETSPVDVANQPWFLNLVAEAHTSLLPMQLLARAMKVERSLGRRRTVPRGPRTIDIDILFFGSFVIDTPRLTVPHPRLAERRFVLAPLADLAPDLRHPVNRRTVQELLDTAPRDQVVRRVAAAL
jgi:2-amino-4-hydroxy-6-hydroxymethyldihydropteridine diphosphokinase